MTTRERIIEGLSGKKMDKVPLTVYDCLFHQYGISLTDERIKRLRSKGMGLIIHTETYSVKSPDVEIKTFDFYENEVRQMTNRLITPIGEIYSIHRDGWLQEPYLKTLDDYRVMEYIVRNQVIEPDYDAYEKAYELVGEDGIVVVTAGRTPYQKILVDLAGLEAFSYHLADEPEAVYSLYDALLSKEKELFDIIAKGPGDIVKLWENITGDAIGNNRYQEFHQPVYNELYPKMKEVGKLLALHMDGNLNCIRKGIEKSAFDIVESFTPPPEGDILLEDALDMWTDKTFWLTIPSYAYESDDFLRKYTDRLVKVSANQRLVLEIAEYFPVDGWEKQIDLILDTLNGG